jgi:hypothetical protein
MESKAVQRKAKPLPKNILKIIFTYIDAGSIFKLRLHALNSLIYKDIDFVGSLVSTVLMPKLGVVNDYIFEINYIREVTGLPVDESKLKRNFQNLERL